MSTIDFDFSGEKRRIPLPGDVPDMSVWWCCPAALVSRNIRKTKDLSTTSVNSQLVAQCSAFLPNIDCHANCIGRGTITLKAERRGFLGLYSICFTTDAFTYDCCG